MPNGYHNNWIRMCGAMDGFYMRYGRWPTRVRMSRGAIETIKADFTPADFIKITEKITLVSRGMQIVAEDESGAAYNYSTDGFPEQRPTPKASDWLGVEPIPVDWGA